MVDVPPETPVTIPEIDPTVATEVLPLVQVPPVVAFDKVVVIPTQVVKVPVIGVETDSLTITILVATELPQPLATV